MGYQCKYYDYYKEGIKTNVKSFLQILEKGSTILIEEDRGLEGDLEETHENDEMKEVNEDLLIELIMKKEL